MNSRATKVTILSLATLILGLAFSFAGVFLVDPSENDGLFGNLAILGSPAMVSTVVITLLMNATVKGQTEPYSKWFYVLVFGLFPLSFYGIFLAAAIQNPEYFAPEDDGGLLTASWLFLLMFLFAAIGGFLIWFAVVFPLGAILKNIRDTVKGKKVPLHSYILPVTMLVATGFILLAAGAVDPDGIGRGAGIVIIFAILGIPGPYEIRSEELLWITRAIVALVIISILGLRMIDRKRSESSKTSLK